MTPQEKAIGLYNHYEQLIKDFTRGVSVKELAKESALVAINEIVKVCPYYSKDECETIEQLRANDYEFISYWEEVKQEIEKL